MQEPTEQLVEEPTTKTIEEVEKEEKKEDQFKPQGSLVFFGLLIIIIAVIWFSVYLTMINRS